MKRQIALVFALGGIGGIDTVRMTLDGQWRAAVQEADSRRADFRTRAQAFDDLGQLDWKLPAVVGSCLDDARRRAGEIMGTLPMDVGAGVRALQDAQQMFGTALHERGAAWQQASRLALQRVLDARVGLPESLLAAVSAQLGTFADRFPILDRLPRRFDPAILDQSLRSVAGEYLALRDVMAVIRRDLQRIVHEVAAALPAEPRLLPQVEAALRPVLPLLDALADTPEPGDELAAALQRLQQAWEDDLTARADADAVDTVRSLVQAQKFKEAAGNLSPEHHRLAAAPPASGPLPVFSAAVLPAMGGTSPVALLTAATRPFFTGLQSSLRNLRLAKGVQTLVTGALFVLSMTVTQLATWDGTWGGLAAIFFAAVAVDVTADAVLSRLNPSSTVSA